MLLTSSKQPAAQSSLTGSSRSVFASSTATHASSSHRSVALAPSPSSPFPRAALPDAGSASASLAFGCLGHPTESFRSHLASPLRLIATACPPAPALLALAGLLTAVSQIGCSALAPQPRRGGGGQGAVVLGGATVPTTLSLGGPENPQSPSVQTLEKTTERVFSLPSSTSPPVAPPPPALPASPGSSAPSIVTPPPAGPIQPSLLRETVTERASTQLGISRPDTTAALTARLANLRGVLWLGVALLVGGPVIGWRLGWMLNGCIAGAVGLLLIILSTVLPGHEAWFGLIGLLLIPLIAFVYYRAHHDARLPSAPSPLASPPASA